MIQSVFKKLAKHKTINKLLDNIGKDPQGFGLRFIILANVAKDAINCGFYVKQSLDNKDIPEDKRKFVAALDMANGLLMIATQLLLGFKFTRKEVQDKFTKRLFGSIEQKATDFVNGRILSHPTDFQSDLRIRLKNTIKNIPNGCKAGFTAISTIVATTILAKRVIVPFIATPLASWLKNKYMDKKPDGSNEPKQTSIQNINPVNMQLPVNLAVKQKTNIGSMENYNNFVYKGVLFNS